MIERLKVEKSIVTYKLSNFFNFDLEIMNIVVDAVLINFLLVAISMFNRIHIINIIMIGGYLYYLTKLDKKANFFNCIILFLESKFLIENFWYATYIDINTYIFKIQPLVIIILLLKTLKGVKLKELIKDKVLVIALSFMLLGIVREFFVLANLNDIINGIYVYGSILVFYLYVKLNDFEYELFYKFILVLQFPLVLFEFIIYKDQDQMTGIFGLHATNWSMIFLAFAIYYTFALYLEKRMEFAEFLIVVIYCFTLFMINESKMAFFVIPFCIVVIMMVSKINIKKKIAIALTIVVISIIGMVGIIKIYPSFKNILFNPKNALNYVLNEKSGAYRYSRVLNIEHSKDVILKDEGQVIAGVGMGRAIPDREFNIEMYKRDRWYNGTENSVLYEKFGDWGYVQTSFNTMWIEIGVIGVLVYFTLILMFLRRAILIIKYSVESRDRALAIGYIGYVIGWILMYFYSDVFYTFNSNMMFFILAGLVANKYANLKRTSVKR